MKDGYVETNEFKHLDTVDVVLTENGSVVHRVPAETDEAAQTVLESWRKGEYNLLTETV